MTESNLLRLQLFGMLGLVFVLTLALGGYFTLQQTRSFREDSAALEAAGQREQKAMLEASLTTLHNQLDLLRQSSEAVLKNDIRQQVDHAVQIAAALYQQEKGRRPEGEIRQLIVETLRPLRFFNGSGYFFIDDLAGNCVLLPINPEREGHSLLDNRDVDGRYIMRDLLASVANPQQRGFSRYRWYAPGNPASMADKVSYARVFEPFGWLIGSGEYLSKIEHLQQQQALQQLRAMRLGSNGYIAVIHRDGRVLLSPSNPAAEGRRVDELPAVEQAVIRNILDTSHNGGGFTRYQWRSLVEPRLNAKLSLVSNLEEWGWILVSGVYQDDLQQSLAQRQLKLEEDLHASLKTTVLALLLVMALALVLAAGLSRWLSHRFARYQQDIDAGHERLRVWAESDPLTLLPNRACLHTRLDEAIARARSDGLQLALLFIDLDRFKNINDSLGHAIGDGLLIQVAQRMAAVLRASDTVSRLGGDEFVVLLEGLSHSEPATQVANLLLQATSGQYSVAGHDLAITLSIGIAVYPADGEDAQTLLKNADAAMYHAKACGRNNFQFFAAAMNTRVREHLELENRLRQALARHELSLHYQPQYDLQSGRLSGCEALMRWHNPELGQVAPDKFIPIAEDSGLILPLGEWALNEACRQVMAWQAQGLPLLSVAVNVSAVQFRHADLAAMVERVLRSSGLPPALLELELTESVLAENLEQVNATLQRLKQLGVRLAMDDFGTGYSSLAYLKHFKLDTLKIDRSFVSDLPGSSDNAALAITIIGMARSLGMTCIAEGIETMAQHDFLRGHGCTHGQGYRLSKPLASAAMAELLATSSRHAATPAVVTAPAAAAGTD
ncbi:cache domain-containing protein [Pseudomonas sp. MAP12]|uniref:Cache domain-containing protein n=1 Tax=Geopseudomonas aromaticivorans TaxID=2849492 RepID=A0ABS6MV00_9GAMM|nr:EAL domain-containing protein [Pseudomonas aromaticivorans]MBV2132636.1 cache domain-containing protein [Pseudomonas aromaticivorans]